MFGDKKMGNPGEVKQNQADLVFMKELIEDGKVKPFIDRRYSLSEAVEAFRYISDGHARGKVVIQMGRGRERKSAEE